MLKILGTFEVVVVVVVVIVVVVVVVLVVPLISDFIIGFDEFANDQVLGLLEVIRSLFNSLSVIVFEYSVLSVNIFDVFIPSVDSETDVPNDWMASLEGIAVIGVNDIGTADDFKSFNGDVIPIVVDFRELILDVNGTAFDLRGSAVDVIGTVVDFRESTVDVIGTVVDLREPAVDTFENGVDLRGFSENELFVKLWVGVRVVADLSVKGVFVE